MKLFVGSLDFKIRDAELRKKFEEVGPVRKATVVMQRDDPERSRGFGFVEYEDPADAVRAMDILNGAVLGRREIDVKEAQPQTKGHGR